MERLNEMTKTARALWRNPADRILFFGLLLMFGLGVLFGLVYLGWNVYPVVYIPGGPESMSLTEQAEYVEMAAEWYSYSLDGTKAQAVLADWHGDALACRMAAATDDVERRIRYLALAWAVNGRGCE